MVIWFGNGVGNNLCDDFGNDFDTGLVMIGLVMLVIVLVMRFGNHGDNQFVNMFGNMLCVRCWCYLMK